MIAPSLAAEKHGVGTLSGTEEAPKGVNGVNGINGHVGLYPWPTPSEPNNPTVVPTSLLSKFHWIFLIRDPHRSIPSYYRCTIPPLDKLTGFYEFYPSEAGYVEVRLVFDYLQSIGLIGPRVARGSAKGETTNGTAVNGNHKEGDEIFVLDADDMLNEPAAHIEACCNSIGYPYSPDMLDWDNEKHQEAACKAFEKWAGFHEDAIDSTGLHAREKNDDEELPKAEEEWDAEWREKFGAKGAKVIRETVDVCMEDYLYMKQFALKLD